MILVKRTFEDGTTEEKEFTTIAQAKKAKGKKKVAVLRILDKVTGAILALITLIKAVKK